VSSPSAATLERLSAALGDRYRAERELGRGGMATVFLAHDLRHDREVALKVLHPELAASVGSERFDREIKVSAKLHHPHILSLYDSGAAGELLYYVMPYVEGESLRNRIDREKMLAVDDALGITLEVADALGYAHMLGIVHRDIKPENILLSGGHALVADFGIARAVHAAEEHRLTQTGTAVGTPLYMSPEQALGDEVGPSSDLYSLACVAYEMLTGQPPFTGANARAIMARHTMEAVPSLRLVRDAVPEEVEEALLWALSKVPADRPRTAAQFAEALGTPLGATATRRATRSRTTAAARVSGARAALRRRRSFRAGLAGAAALVVAAAAWGLWPRGGAAAGGAAAEGLDPHRVGVLYFEDQSPGGDLAYLADGLTEGLITALSEVRELRVVSRSGAAQVRGGELPADSVARLLGAGTLVRGSIEPEGDQVRVTVRLVEGGSGAEFQRASFRLPLDDPLGLEEQLARHAAALVRARLGQEIRLREQRMGTRNVDAWVLLQRAERSRKQLDSAAAGGDPAQFERLYLIADSLAERVEVADRRWVAPVVLRGTLAYRRSRLAVDDPVAAERWIAIGLGHAGRALALDGRNPDALELRGTLRYWRWLLGLERDDTRAQALLMEAKADLEQAVAIRPAQAGAWATLSHLYNQTGSGLDVNVAARRALEEDAFLGNADVILTRLFFSSYDLGQFTDARHWCEEGARRFPANQRFVECRLWMLTTRAEEPDVARAWRLVDSLLALTPDPDRAYQRLNAQLAVAAVLARAGRADSARELAARSRGDAELDPSRDLANIAAFVYTLLGDTTAAVDQLKLYLTANPSKRSVFADDPGWWFRGIAASDGFRRLVGSQAR
jgi:serine/threonine-protein kinase